MVTGRGCQSDVEAAKWRLSQGYSRSSPLYDALAGHLYLSSIRKLLPRVVLPPIPAILDVGCGTGINLLEAARWFSPTRLLCGIDISPGMVEVASRKAAALGLNAGFAVGDAEHLPYPDNTFDLVICNSVLHWFDPVIDRRGVGALARGPITPRSTLTCVGTMMADPSAELRPRSTPTCVGTIGSVYTWTAEVPVHPHVCGDDVVVPLPDPRASGPPPRVWGRCTVVARSCRHRRSTPTCVVTIAWSVGG